MRAGASKKRSALPMIGGIIIVISGIYYIAAGASGLLVSDNPIWSMFADEGDENSDVFMALCGAILLVVGIIVVLGGFFAIKRRRWSFAVIAGTFVVPSIIGLAGIILIILSREEFD